MSKPARAYAMMGDSAGRRRMLVRAPRCSGRWNVNSLTTSTDLAILERQRTDSVENTLAHRFALASCRVFG